MSLTISQLSLLFLIFFAIAFIYSSVGFGGGSSYLAILGITLINFYMIRTTALLCNLFVVSGSCYLFYKNGHLKFKRFAPYVITSIPLAFIGALFNLGQKTFFIILGSVLIFSAFFLIYQSLEKNNDLITKEYPTYFSYILGALIGFLSGIVGIGGGIFLAPILNHLKWDKPIVISSLASFFILVNSVSALFGLSYGGSLSILWPNIIVLIIAVVLGGQLGVRLSIVKFSPKLIRILTAVLVFFAGIRILINTL